MLATGDSDFGPVFRRLRELGKGVVGVGPSSVLSSSVALSCHQFIFTDEDNRSGSAKKGRGNKGHRGERSAAGGGGATATWAGMAGRAAAGSSPLRPRMATPPQLLSARGGFRIKRQPPAGAHGGGPEAAHPAHFGGERGFATSPLLIGGPPPPPAAQAAAAEPATFGVGKGPVIDWTAMPPPSTPTPPQPSQQPQPRPSSPLDLSAAFARVALEEKSPPPAEPVLSPGQLLLPGMVTAAASSSSAAAAAASPSLSPPAASRAPSARAAAEASSPETAVFGVQDYSRQTSSENFGGVASGGGGGGSGGGGGRNDLLLPPAFSGLGALSVVRPSEKLYRHLLAVDSSSSGSAAAAAAGGGRGAGTGSLASDWGSGLSEVAVARGLVSLAGACGGSEHGEGSWAIEALGGFSASLGGDRGPGGTAAAGGGGDFGGGGGGVGEGGGGLGREEAFRVATLLQRCGFLSWVAKEQQWLVTVPADVEVLRRRRDEVMMEELLTRCQEAGVPFDPALAANLLWSRG